MSTHQRRFVWGWIFTIYMVVFGTLVIILTYTDRQEDAERRQQRLEADIDICEGGRALSESQVGLITRLADLALSDPDLSERGRELVITVRDEEIARVPTFDCEVLPRP